MAKKLHSITVRGNNHTWTFHAYLDPQYLDEWREDGLEIDEIQNTVPAWTVDLGLSGVWCFLQDCFHLKNPLA